VRGTYAASAHFTFDQFDQDQIFVMHYGDQNGRRQVGITINDRHEQNIFAYVQQRDSINRLADTAARAAALRGWPRARPAPRASPSASTSGATTAKRAVLDMRDKLGRTRLRLVVDSLGAGRIDFVDADGRVTRSITGGR
jgi:hypothetical protein